MWTSSGLVICLGVQIAGESVLDGGADRFEDGLRRLVNVRRFFVGSLEMYFSSRVLSVVGGQDILCFGLHLRHEPDNGTILWISYQSSEENNTVILEDNLIHTFFCHYLTSFLVS